MCGAVLNETREESERDRAFFPFFFLPSRANSREYFDLLKNFDRR